jgi:hypothetical protein
MAKGQIAKGQRKAGHCGLCGAAKVDENEMERFIAGAGTESAHLDLQANGLHRI